MRKKINIVLGTLIALLSGCKTQQEIVKPEQPIRVMYGPPAYFQQQEQQTVTQESTEDNIGNKQ